MKTTNKEDLYKRFKNFDENKKLIYLICFIIICVFGLIIYQTVYSLNSLNKYYVYLQFCVNYN